MTLRNYSNAIDDIFARFLETWTDGRANTVCGYVPVILWEGKKEAAKADFSKYIVRVTQQTVIERQIAFGVNYSEGRRKYETSGLVFIQIFAPQIKADAKEKGRLLASIAQSAYRGKYAQSAGVENGRIVFYNVRINELPDELDSYRFNVVAEYEYDEIG